MLEYSFDRSIAVSSLQRLLRQTSWANDRSDADVALAISNTQVQIGVWRADQLIGYARAITDGRFRALIDDVIVDETQRGFGVGGEMMKRLVARLAEVSEILLLADDRNTHYYRRLGFELVKANCLRWPCGAPPP